MFAKKRINSKDVNLFRFNIFFPQFIDLLPAGSLLSVVTAGFRAREVRMEMENKLYIYRNTKCKIQKLGRRIAKKTLYTH